MEAFEATGLREYAIANMHVGKSNSVKLTNGNEKNFLIVLSRCMISRFSIASLITCQS